MTDDVVIRWLPLGLCAKVLKGTTPAPRENSTKGLYFIGQSEVRSGGHALLRRVQVFPDDGPEPTYLQLGDLVISSLGPKRRVLMVNELADGAILGRECLAVRLPSNRKYFTPKFLMAWMKTDDFVRQVDALTTGMTMPRLTQRSLEDVQVPWLTPKHQELVTAIADKFDTATAALRSTLAQVEELEGIELDLAFLEDSDEG